MKIAEVSALNDKSCYEDELKKSGLKITKSRKAIIDMLVQSSHPITAEQIYLELKENEVEINLSTIYRTLEVLVDKRLVTKLNIIDNDRTLFEYNNLGHRHYLVCLGCKKIITIQGCPLESYEKSLEKQTQFAMSGHRLYLYGYCLDCQKKMID